MTCMRLYFLICLLALALVFDTVKSSTLSRQRRSPIGPVWPTKKIPYAFSNIIEFDFEARATIERAIKLFEISLTIDGDSCIEFVPRKSESNYILFVDGGDCSSGIGYYSGVNRIR